MSNVVYVVKLCILFLCLLGSKYTFAEEVIVLGNESMPFNGVVNGQNAGMTYEILEQATRYGAPHFKFQLGLPWKRAQKLLLQAGESPVAIVPFTRTEQRESKHTWIAKLISYQTRVSTRDKTPNLALSSITRKPIGIIRGSAHIPFLKELGFERLSIVNKASQNASKLASGHIYGIVESQFVDTYHWKRTGLSTRDLQFIPLGHTKHIYIAGNLSFPPHIAKKIAAAIHEMARVGQLQEIISRWEK